MTDTTLEDVFCEAARALFSLLSDVDSIRPRVEEAIRVQAPTRPLLLVEWLSELLTWRDLSGLLLSRFDVRIAEDEDHGFVIEGTVQGEPFDPSRHPMGVEVKGISYSGLEVRREGDGWTAQCVVDV